MTAPPPSALPPHPTAGPPSDGRPLLVLGAGGRVGRLLRPHWPAGAVRALARRAGAGVDGLWAPLDGPAGLLDHLQRWGVAPAALVMLAGATPGPGVAEAALAAHAPLAEACLQAARAAGIGRVLLASSAAVYGVDPQGRPFAEDSTPAPLSAYGRAKLAMEAVADPFRAAGLQVCALRIGNVAGADALLHPLTAALGQPGPRSPVDLHGFADGQGPLRSYIGVKTLARVLADLAHGPAPLPAVLNLAAPRPLRMQALAQAAGWPCRRVPAPAGAHQVITLDCRRLAAQVALTEDDSDPAAMVAQWKASLFA